MRHLLILAMLAAPMPLAAQPQTETEEGLSLIERGIGIIARNLWSEFGPQLDELGNGMGGTLADLVPMLENLSALVDDLGNYHTPERLENGDILIRRHADAPPPPPLGDLAPPSGDPPSAVPIDPDQPEIPL